MPDRTRFMDGGFRAVQCPVRRRVSIAAAVCPADCPGGASGNRATGIFPRITRRWPGLSFPVGTIPGGRGGPESVAPALLPVDLPGGVSPVAARIFAVVV